MALRHGGHRVSEALLRVAKQQISPRLRRTRGPKRRSARQSQVVPIAHTTTGARPATQSRQAGKAGTTTRSDHGYSMSGAPLNPRRQSTNHHQRRRSSRSHLGKLGGRGLLARSARLGMAEEPKTAVPGHSIHCRSWKEETSSRSRTIPPLLRTRMVMRYPTPILATAVCHTS